MHNMGDEGGEKTCHSLRRTFVKGCPNTTALQQACQNYGYTVNVTGETLVLNKYFPSKKKGFIQHKAGKVGKIGIFPA